MTDEAKRAPYLIVLGVAQDGGHPQAGCERACCREAWQDAAKRHLVTCLGLVDPGTKRYWLIDATPDIKDQLHRLTTVAGGGSLAGVFVTHAHTGHYIGLLQLGREAMGAREVPVYAMPRMKEFLAWHSPWAELESWGHITLRTLEGGRAVKLGDGLRVVPVLVPHRGEFSETVGYRIEGPARRALYLPDIDSWEEWDTPVEKLVRDVDALYVDGTFFSGDELPGRDMSKIPHPLIEQTMSVLSSQPPEVKLRLRFIHLNHTNPALREGTAERRAVLDAGFRVAEEGERFDL